MDVSKLPRLSKTGQPPEQTPSDQNPPGANAPPPQQVPVDHRAAQRVDSIPLAAEIWITFIVGLIFLALGRSFAEYEIAMLRHQPYHTGATWQTEGPLKDTEVPYPQLDASFGLPFYGDSGCFLFGASMVVIAAAQLLTTRRSRLRQLIAWGALLLVIAATGYNVFVAGKLFAAGIIPILALLCVAFGGYEAFVQYRIVRPTPLAA